MDQAEKTIIENLHKNTGRTLEQWIDLVKQEKIEKHGQTIKFHKEQHRKRPHCPLSLCQLTSQH